MTKQALKNFKLIKIDPTHEKYLPSTQHLTLYDYDVHTWYLNSKMDELKIPEESQFELYKFEDLHRAWILQGNYVKSNINRINNWYKLKTKDKSILGKRAILKQ